MAKLSSASIRLVQKMNRKNKNGEFPIYIVVCFKGRLEKSTGVSCHYLSTPNASVSGLASLMARSPNTIATYIHQLTKDEDIAMEVENMVI